jgi:iron-sulfur cluster repair protein YtfE (RIC family)
MDSMRETSWPPRLDSLAPIPDSVPATSGPVPFPDPARTILLQHRELTRILADLAETTDRLAAVSGSTGAKPIERLRKLMEELNHFLAPHRDTEESVLFPFLIEEHPDIASQLDDLSDQHVTIFDECRAVNRILDHLDLEPDRRSDHLAALLPALRSFIKRVWRHTLEEETLFRR